jgi:hypothetical protein
MLVASDIAVNWAVSEVIVAVGVLLVETVVVSAVAVVTDLCTGAGVLLLSTSPDFQFSLVLLLVFTAVDVHEIHGVKISDVAAFPAAVDDPYAASVSHVSGVPVVASVHLHAFLMFLLLLASLVTIYL